jgi:hypothetical protein
MIEIEGVWYVEGNRTLASLNLRLNRITDTGVEALLKVFPINPVLVRFVCERNPYSDGIFIFYMFIFGLKKPVRGGEILG